MPEIVIKSETQKVAEAKVEGFRSGLGPFVVAAETTRMAMLFMDAKEPGNPIIFANDAFLDLTGYDREEVLGQCFNFLMARGTDPDSLARIDIAFAGTPKGGSEICYRRKDGGEFWSAILISPVRDESGDVVQHFASFVDLTDHKQEHAQSRMLIDELNQRVKNTLATVQSIVWQALRNTTDPEVIRESIGTRLSALSRSHDLLTHENWEGAGLYRQPRNRSPDLSDRCAHSAFQDGAHRRDVAANSMSRVSNEFGSHTGDLGAGVLGLAGLGVYFAWERVSAHPMTPPRLGQNRAFVGLNTATLLIYAGLAIVFFLLPFELVEHRDLSPASVGLAFLPFTLGVGLLSRFFGGLADTFGARRMLVAGAVCASAAYIWMALAQGAALVPGVVLPQALLGISFAVMVAPLTASVLSSVTASDEGLASGINNAISRVAQLAGVALAAGLGTLSSGWQWGLFAAAALSAGGAVVTAFEVPPAH
jgi:PAS domain S-box-containing protein